MIFSFRSITGLALLVALLSPNQAQAHRFAPSLLKIVESTQHNYNVVWKTSNGGDQQYILAADVAC